MHKRSIASLRGFGDPLVFQHNQITAAPTPAQVAQRSYTVAYNELWAGRGMPWCLRKFGAGHWCVAHGEPNYFTSEQAAHDEGARWNETGRAA